MRCTVFLILILPTVKESNSDRVKRFDYIRIQFTMECRVFILEALGPVQPSLYFRFFCFDIYFVYLRSHIVYDLGHIIACF